jgi:hypothetical protein
VSALNLAGTVHKNPFTVPLIATDGPEINAVTLFPILTNVKVTELVLSKDPLPPMEVTVVLYVYSS